MRVVGLGGLQAHLPKNQFQRYYAPQNIPTRIVMPVYVRTVIPSLLMAAAACNVWAEQDIEEVLVFGRAEQQIGTTQTASEGLVGYDDISLPPLLRVGELVEAVPGMVATQHSGTGKANQYFLRGFNLDHGTDFSAHVNGVPINMRNHGHGQGYLDLNSIIPELVKTTAYRKGPYHASKGDFSSAGSVDFSLYQGLTENLIKVTYGEYDYSRILAAGSTSLGAGTVIGALDMNRYNGPWELEENLKQHKGYLGYSLPIGDLTANFTLQTYDSEWDATDQIPLRAVESGVIDALGYIDPDLGGETQRHALTMELTGSRWRAGGYLVDYDFTLFSNFTYLLDNPTLGDEFEQRDDRQIWGVWVSGERSVQLPERTVDLRWGVDTTYNDINEVGLFNTAARQRFSATRDDSIKHWSASAWASLEVPVTERLRAIAGLRGDLFNWDVNAQLQENSGTGKGNQLSPSLNLAYRFSDNVEAYASWGHGFHSNDVRGTTITIDPSSGEAVQPVDALVRSVGTELGLRVESGQRFNASLAVFRLELGSELLYVGDAGTTEPNNGSMRTGIELASFWQVTNWLSLNAAYTWTDAQYQSSGSDGNRIPGAVEDTATLGANAAWTNGLSASLRARYLGEAPLAEDNAVRSTASWLVNAGVAYRWGKVEFRVDVFNLLDSDDNDIAYFYTSRLPDEPSAGVEDIHFHPLEPRSARGSVTYHWGG